MSHKWIIKAVVQKGISYLPLAHRINYFFQRNITGGVHLDDAYFRLKLGHGSDHLKYYDRFGSPGPDNTILELGTGWYPVVPLLFFLTSSGRVISADIRPWMNSRTQYLTILKYKEWKEKGLLETLAPRWNEDRWKLLMDAFGTGPPDHPEQFNKLIGLRTIVGDARNTGLQDGLVDFICSNNTFEHIPERVLIQILREFRRLVRPGGTMSHFIDMSDHFAHFDSSITIYNFLKYGQKLWKFIDNNIQPQNRLRFCDYIAMYRELHIPVTLTEIRKGDFNALEQVPVHPEFSKYTAEELAVSHGYIVSRMNPDQKHPESGSVKK